MKITRQVGVPLALVLLQTGCAVLDTSEGEVAQEANVTWANPIKVTTTANSLTKNSAVSAWNAGASSVNTFTNNGYCEFTTDENTTSKMAGLSSDDTSVVYTDIDFAIHLKADGRVNIREGGVQKAANVSTYVAGDVFRVESSGGVVTYSENGAPIYVSDVAPSTTLLVDTSLYTPGSTITEVVLVATSLTWQNAVNVLIDENNLTKTVGHPWNAGASSVETITGGGAMEFTTAETTLAKMAGLSNGDSGVDSPDIDYAIRLTSSGGIRVYEDGTFRGSFGTYVAGDVFRVEANGMVVTYAQNGNVFYTSAVAPTYPLGVDTSLLDKFATIRGVTLQ